MKYFKLFLIMMLLFLNITVYAEDENDNEIINTDVSEDNYEEIFKALLDSKDYKYIMNTINNDDKLYDYIKKEADGSLLGILESIKFDYYNSDILQNIDEDNLSVVNEKYYSNNKNSNINYNFNGFVSGALKVGDGVNYEKDLRYIYDGNNTLRIKGHQHGDHNNTHGFLAPIDSPDGWRFYTNTSRIIEWIPNYGTYLGESVGREVIIDVLQKGNPTIMYATKFNPTKTGSTIYLENVKQAQITVSLYKNVDKNNNQPNGNRIDLNTQADAILFGANGLTNQTSDNGTQEYYAPYDDNIPLYTTLPKERIGIAQEFNRTVYYSTLDASNIQIYANVKGLKDIKSIVGIRGNFDRDPTMHFYLGFDLYKTSFPLETYGYILNVDLNGGNYSGQKIYEGNKGSIINIPTPNKDYYLFKGWELIKGDGILSNNKFTFKESDATIKAKWEKVNYKINYILNGGINNSNNPSSYVGDKEIIINDPTRENYTFEKWSEGNKIPKGSTGDKTFTANWNINKCKIEYILDEGINHEDNPDYYTVESEITLNNPTKEGYTFLGFKEGNVINVGTNCDGKAYKTFTALWELNKYPIEYILNGGNNHEDNPQEYTWFDEIEIKDAYKKGYTFKGWKEGNLIALHSIGLITKTAKWQINKYNIKYNLYGGQNHKNNPSSYTIEDEIKILDATKNGYEFMGWKEGNIIKKGSIGDKEFNAQYKTIIYDIEYNLDGGINDPFNPLEYTIEDEIRINNPTKKGYTFIGWKEGNIIPKGSTGKKTFTAQWKKMEYIVVNTKVC